MSEGIKKRRFFYGWVVVGAAMIIAGVAMGMVANTFGLFIVPVCEELKFTRSQMSANQTLFAVGGMAIALFSGYIFTRFRLKRLMITAAIIMCGAYFTYSVATKLWMFYLASAALSVCMALLTWMPLTIIIGNWFVKKRGLMTGLAFMGSGAGGMLFNALGGAIMARLEWRGTFLTFFVIMAALLLPSVIFLLKVKPSDVGQKPYGEGEISALGARADIGLTLKQALKTPRLYLLCACVFFTGIALNSFNCTVAPQMQTLGYSERFAAWVNSGYMAGLALGKLALGWLFDKLGARRASAVSFISLTIALTALALSHIQPLVALVVACGGLGTAYGSVSYQFTARESFGEKDYAAITGVLVAISGLGGAFGPVLAGVAFDAQGSYAPYMLIMAALTAVFGALTLILARKDKRVTAAAP